MSATQLTEQKSVPVGLGPKLVLALADFIFRKGHFENSERPAHLRLSAPSIISICVLNGAIGAGFTALYYQSWLRFFIALLVLPLGALLATWITAWFLKIVHRAVHQIHLPFRALCSTLAVANIPWWCTTGLVDGLPILTGLGFLTSTGLTLAWIVRDLSHARTPTVIWVLLMATTHSILWVCGLLVIAD